MHRTRDDVQTPHDDIARVLAPLGLRLSEAKTRIAHMSESLDFLGFRIQWRGMPAPRWWRRSSSICTCSCSPATRAA